MDVEDQNTEMGQAIADFVLRFGVPEERVSMCAAIINELRRQAFRQAVIEGEEEEAAKRVAYAVTEDVMDAMNCHIRALLKAHNEAHGAMQ